MGVAMNEKKLRNYLLMLVVGLLIFVPASVVKAQQVSLSVEPSAALQNAQILSLSSLGIDRSGSGPVLISAFLENEEDQELDNLFIEVNISSARVGTIVEFTSDSEFPFSMRPMQSVYVTNNDLANEQIPGIRESVRLKGGLTPEGEDFLNDLSGATTLPQDTYFVQVIIFRETPATGIVELAEATAEISSNAFYSLDEREIYLKAPGDVVGNQTTISNNYPQFSWEGSNTATYRLIVVEATGTDSPESLIQGAKSSQPTGKGGNLLEYENLDRMIEGNSFQFPSSGVQSLERGKTYFWRVINTVSSSNDEEDISSEIWTFSLATPENVSGTINISEEAETAIVSLIGEEEFERLKEQGFRLESLEFEGQEFTGATATLKLEEILQLILDNKLIKGGS
jgi:hypothetical protein